jgi:hypothetical protein
MDREDIKKLRKEYLARNKEALDWILSDLDDIVRERIVKGYSKIYITDLDIKSCVIRYNSRVDVNGEKPRIWDDVSTQDIMLLYVELLHKNGIVATTLDVVHKNTMINLRDRLFVEPSELDKKYLVIIVEDVSEF